MAGCEAALLQYSINIPLLGKIFNPYPLWGFLGVLFEAGNNQVAATVNYIIVFIFLLNTVLYIVSNAKVYNRKNTVNKREIWCLKNLYN